jgi:hypothetical protein
MRMEDREEYVDMVAQAVIDRIEERDRLAVLVDLVVRRVMELQEQKQAALAAAAHDSDGAQDPDSAEETQDAGE